MIKLENVSKKFDKIEALENLSTNISKGSIYGLIGSNGAGKSTFLRLLTGIYLPDKGSVIIDEQEVYENPSIKEKIFYISDDQYFHKNSSMLDMAKYFSSIYTKFSKDTFESLVTTFNLDKNRNLNTFSKGMQKQAHIILALSCHPEYLLCDETFDGLDPVMRLAVKRLLADAVTKYNMTPIIASHNLRELEDICDHVGLLHKGSLVFEKDIDDLKLGIHKVQSAFEKILTKDDFPDLDIISFKNYGKLCSMIIKGDKLHTENSINLLNPLYSEILPLSLEEIFITEMEGLNYDIQEILF
ncbi:MAG: ABC transporter ATP-binding protein [Filifactoraceae bacterium]